MKKLMCLAWTAALILLHASAQADVKLPAIFSDHMVLQRGIKLPIWGTAEADEKVTVSIAGQKVSATADAQGKWRVTLEPISAAEPLAMKVSGKNTLTISDILIGEVWLCSGQSNMSFSVARAQNAAEAIKAAEKPTIRLFTVGRAFKDEPQQELSGKWEICSPATVKDFSAVAYFFGSELQQALKSPVGLIESGWGGTRAEAWIPRKAFDDLHLPYEPEWTQQWLKPTKPDPASSEPARERPYQAPASLYNGMIAPLAGFPIRGALWYQGETNTAYPKEYRDVLTALATSWRAAWNQGDFPFLIVQLPNFKSGTRDWVMMRESQAHAARQLPNAGLVVTIDKGNPHDIHPKDKQPVGHRLAALALKTTYGKDIPYTGPTLKCADFGEDKITLTFDHTDGGLKSKGNLEGFEIAGADGKFEPASAMIQGDQIILTEGKINSATAVRYAWANDPKCTLYNGAGFPAAPFTTRKK
ncbi:MAG TPA: sialate O-acetylesterase [Tepidisphaeraceae bacterium]|jgi:sialate O-acetylesterase